MGRWYAGWNVIAVTLIFQAVSFGVSFFSFTLWVAPWMDTFGASRGDVMTVIVAMQILSGLLAPFAGRLMDWADIRLLVIIGACCCSLALYIAGQVDSLWLLGIAYAGLFGVGTLLCGPLAAQTLAARWFNARRGTAIGLSAVGTSIGGVLVPPLVGYWITAEDWRTAHEYLALLTLVVIVPPVLLFVRNSPQAAGIEAEPDSALSAPDNGWKTWSLRDLLTSPIFLLIAATVTPVVTTTGAVQQNLAPFAADVGLQAGSVATLVSLLAAVMIAGKVFFGVMSDRVSHTLLMTVAIAAIYAALVLMLTNPNYTWMLIMVSLLGFGMGGFLPLLGAMVAARFGPVAFGRVMGLLGPFVTLGATGPLIAGYLRDQTGSYDAPVWLFMGLLVLSLATLFALHRQRAGQPSPQEHH